MTQTTRIQPDGTLANPASSERKTIRQQPPVLVLGGTGKVGRRVADRLTARGVPVRIGARSATPTFDWNNPATWSRVLEGAQNVFISYAPDIAVPGAPQAVNQFTKQAATAGVERVVLLSGRGEEEAEAAERLVRHGPLPWTIVRCSWFAQNFSEHFLLDPILEGQVALPVDTVTEPFVDCDDIAEVAAEALLDDRHAGQLYELTGPRLLTFSDAIGEIARASARPIRFTTITPEEFAAGLTYAGLHRDEVSLVSYLFSTVLDGRNSSLTDGVERALGRPPRDFADYARETAKTGIWSSRD
ncbi:MAG: NAD(P)H-binding protein [Nocardiopsaceae bacterium]|nr:NAD(P)H-binding protein [Nocardiopsaceae bacterium]